MRKVIDLRRPLGSVPIEDIKLDVKSRDDIQAIYKDKATREELFRLPDAHVLPDRFDLRRRELPRWDPRRLQARPKPPFAAARGLEASQGIPVAGDRLQFRMAFVRVRQANPAAVAQAMQIKPIARDVQANDLRMC